MGASLDDIVSSAAEDDFVFDFSGAGPDYSEPVAPGSYIVTLVEAKPGTAKSGNPKIAWQFQVVSKADGSASEFQGRRIFKHTPVTGKGSGLAKKVLKGLGVETGEGELRLSPSKVLGKQAVANVDIQPGTTFNEIDLVKPVEDNSVF